MIIEMVDSVDTDGTSLQGYLEDVSYAELVKVLGEPNSCSDGYKTDVEWQGEIDGLVFTIYNWKNGKNYCGASGMNVADITVWNIGGHHKLVGKLINDYFGK